MLQGHRFKFSHSDHEPLKGKKNGTSSRMQRENFTNHFIPRRFSSNLVFLKVQSPDHQHWNTLGEAHPEHMNHNFGGRENPSDQKPTFSFNNHIRLYLCSVQFQHHSFSKCDFKLNYTEKLLPENHEVDYENAELNHSILHLIQM